MGNKRVNIFQLLTALLVGVLLFISGCSPQMPTSAAESATTVDVAAAEARDIYGSISYSGRLKASREVQVLPQTSARIISINVSEGQGVAAGETLMTLDSSSLQASLKKAEAQVASAKANQVTNQIKLEAARKSYERTKLLYDAGSVTQVELDDAKLAYDSLNSGSVEAAVAEAEASLLSVQEQIGYTSIKAPVSGIIGRIDVSVGDYVNTSNTVAVISDPQELKAEIMVGESDIAIMKLNTKVNVYVRSVGQEPFSGTISSIASVLAADSNMYPVTITLDNAKGEVKSGMYAEVSIAASGVQNALCIPLSSIIPDNGVNVVYSVTEENGEMRAARVEVKTGINDGNYVQIVSGLKAGDKVVTLGNTLISDGSLLTIQSKEGEQS
ncbi:RND family efflux transporter, MFP subunit [Desulfosporosinus orientis DSM 765]|uniref:RND family efflux transporter, MFP subunit n=1 Tax=Desulfosporosinus orientis (strain ATCC 19365 / DSM 765 / NCIMB 8382 / VKM B-1628 / Singapore I) TaxID=768706 RepID=G7WIW1_DESOD|nr:efflux RND transporter periplasmic adaptor subunit [Desulfosporosinus orientis]AET69686.1 RND family efflux transporter, MFP subunit [Desulfosporosinus orientis DSM 765]